MHDAGTAIERPEPGPDAPVLHGLSTLDQFLPVWILAGMGFGLLVPAVMFAPA